MNGVFLPFAAVAAGAVSASSPCMLPVIPGFLAAVSSSGSTRDSGRHSRPSITGAIGFVIGFTVIFIMLGATASALGSLLYARLDVALKFAGLALIVLGLHATGVIRWPALLGERRPYELHRIGQGPRRATALGAVFALGWTPCVGPILATILTKAAADASLAEGMLLLFLYSMGLGLPFLAVAVFFERSDRPRRWLARRSGAVERAGGVAMIAIGIAYLSGAWATFFTGLQRWLARTGWPPI